MQPLFSPRIVETYAHPSDSSGRSNPRKHPARPRANRTQHSLQTGSRRRLAPPLRRQDHRRLAQHPRPDFPATGWEVKDGLLSVTEHGGEEGGNAGDILSTRKYANFELLSTSASPPEPTPASRYFVDTNYAPGHEGHGSAIGFEYQILDDAVHPDAKKGRDGDRTEGLPLRHDPRRKRQARQTRRRVEHRPHRRPTAPTASTGSTASKSSNTTALTPQFRQVVAVKQIPLYPHFGEANDGYILLQDHGFPVSFRNIKIRELPPTPPQ